MKHCKISLFLALGAVSAFYDGAGGMALASSAPEFNLSALKTAALGWGVQVIQAAETLGSPDKLTLAAEGFGKALCENIDALEARAGVLASFLNAPGVDDIEHATVTRALETGGPILAAMLRLAVQGIFTRLVTGVIK